MFFGSGAVILGFNARAYNPLARAIIDKAPASTFGILRRISLNGCSKRLSQEARYSFLFMVKV